MDALRKRVTELLDNDLVVAFSGGVDSSLLLKIACNEAKILNKKVHAVTFETKLHPSCDLENAVEIAKTYGAIHHIIKVNELENIDIKNNPIDRCYRCKHFLFTKLRDFSSDLGVKNIIDGTNFDDLSCYRPGIKALKELLIISPLAELKITKDEVRKMAKSLNLAVSSRPSAPCLATRLPYNTEIDFDLLERIDKGEDFLKNLGFLVNRIRVHGNIARIEIKKEQFNLFIEKSEHITDKLNVLGLSYITLDLEGFRSGSMDINIEKEN